MAIQRVVIPAKAVPGLSVARDIPTYMPSEGSVDAPIVVICDAPTIAMWRDHQPLAGREWNLWVDYAKRYGFGKEDFAFVTPCGPIPNEVEGSEKRLKDYASQFSEALDRTLACYTNVKLFIYTGKLAGQCLTKKPVKIMKQRGVAREVPGVDKPVLPMLSPNHVLRRPEVTDLFDADYNMLRIIADNEFNVATVADALEVATNYEWREDISDILANPPEAISLDTEADNYPDTPLFERVPSYYWYRPQVGLLTVQFSFAEGQAIVCPWDRSYYSHIGGRQLARLKDQVKQLCENPNVKKFAHNYKFDNHMLREKAGINTQGWAGDTQLYAFFVDENMFEKSQDECVRRWVPEMAGYADAFNRTFDKSNMRSVPLENMLAYGGGDADANLRLAKRLLPLVRKDQKQWTCCQRVQWPALKAFANVVEPQGIRINTAELRGLYDALNEEAASGYAELIREVPAAVRRKHAQAGLKFSLDAFVRDILFTKEGFGLKPLVFTKSTRKLKDEEKIPSVSTKDHLPYFDDNEWITKFIRHQKIAKLKSTYVGVENGHHGPTGFWKYIQEGRIHPSYILHRTVTGRTASNSPNGQNIPKHDRTAADAILDASGRIITAKKGNLAKAYRKIFIPSDGYTFIEIDLSQAELRLVAWMAQEPTMLKAYNNGEDIHALTASLIMGISLAQFMALPKEIRKAKRQEAKAVNFGLIYGMSWRKLITYAKTTYQVEFSEDQAQAIHAKYFQTYRGLKGWHKGMREFVHKHGYVRALHGALRHLPNIRSIDEMVRGDCERQAINSPIQRFASDIGICAMGRMCRNLPTELLRPVAFIHDALICEVRLDYVEEGAAAVKFYMESTPFRPWFDVIPPLPITADVSIGSNLAEMVEREGEHAVVAQHPYFYDYREDGFDSIEEAYAYA